VQVNAVVEFVPLGEGGGINLDDGVLNEGLGTNELVVGSVVLDIDDLDLAGNVFGSPGEVAFVQTKSSELQVTTTHTDGSDSSLFGNGCGLSGKLGKSLWSALLESSLLLVHWHATTSGSSLVSAITGNAHSLFLLQARY
jgi:hypothetical protein